MDCELLTTCSALGYQEEDEYFKEPDCIDTVKCLIKYLHNEDSTRDIRVQLGSAQILQRDLLQIMSHYPAEKDLFQAVLRLTVNLTQPTLLCFGGKVPKDTMMHHHFLDVMSYNQAYKEAFGEHKNIWKVLAQKVYDVLETEWEDRLPEDGLLVERILVLIRNLLHIPATSEDGKKTSSDLSTHDKLLWQMHLAGIDSLLLYLASSTVEQEWCLHVIEIICLFLKEQNPEQLAKTGKQRSEAERLKEGDELLQMRKREDARKQQTRAKMTPWHSRFGGTYVMRGTKAIADSKDIIVHRSVRKCDKISFDDGKTKLKKARNRRALVDDAVNRRSTLSIRNMLKEFSNGLLESGYNVLLRAIKDRLSREKAQDHDETYYFWAMSFFLEFNRLCNFRIELVSETIQLATLHFLDTQILNCYELMLNDKQEAQIWGRRMHLALRCYHEFLMTVHTMESSSDHALKESAKVLQNNIFYVVEYREIFLMLLRKFDERKQTRAFLKDLIKTTHLFLKMFENYCKQSTVVVQKKVRARNKKSKKKKKSSLTQMANSLSEEDRARKWGEINEIVKDKVQVPLDSSDLRSTDVFDPISDVTEEEQQRQAVLKIQRLLLNSDCEEAIKVLRLARDVWPEKNIFGSSDISAEQEVAVLHEISLADLSNINEMIDPAEEEQEEEIEEEEEESAAQSTKEIEFNFREYLKKFADSKIVIPYVKLLKEFDHNDAAINHCIVKMLHRVAYDLKMYGLLFQASLFRIFQKIFVDASVDKSLRELESFGKWVVVKFHDISVMNTNICTEILFWKNSAAEVYELVEGYGTFSGAEGKRKAVTWTEDEVSELTDLYHKYKDSDTDVVDEILSNITDETRSRRQICQQLVNQGLVESMADLKRAKGSRTTVWRDDDIEELQRLFEEFSASEDPVGNIMQMMSNKKSKKKIIEKILSLGLAADKKQLYKKRARKPRATSGHEIMHIGGATDDEDVDKVESDESSEDEDTDPEERIKNQLNKCHEAGLSEEILWVRNSLESALEDRNNVGIDDEDTIQPIPLVPFSEAQENAIENRSFKKLLKQIYIKPPANEQEMFWRIPSSLKSDEIQNSIKLLTNLKRKRPDDHSASDSDNSDDLGIARSDKRKKRALTVIDDDEEE